jgi:hypothetical protein
MSKYPPPVCWVLYALVPLLAGLFVVEHRASLSPTGHRVAQVGIVLLIYGLVWLWLRAHVRRRLWSDHGSSDRERAIAACAGPIRAPGSRLTPRQAQIIHRSARHHYRRIHPHAKGGGVRKCSVNFDRRSSSWRSSH